MKSKRGTGTALRVVIALFLTVVSVLCGDATEKAVSYLALQSAKSYLPCAVSLSEAVGGNQLVTTVTEKTEKVTEAITEKASDDLTSTDSDLLNLIKQAKENSVSDRKDGDIYEYTFTDDGVTDSYGCIRVKNTNKTQPEIEKNLAEDLELKATGDKPMVLLYHTHTTETYQLLDRDFYAEGFLSRSNDENLNMVRVGKAVKQELEKMGYGVIHDTTIYDNPYSGAYYRSMDAAELILEKYPSIQITIDLHRDAIQNDEGVKTKPTAVINGKKAAQIMIISGCQEEGNGITDLPEWEKNLTFALKLQQSMEKEYPGLTRPLFFCARSYNMSLTPCSLLVEVGADANTLDEAVYSGKMLGRALGKVISEAL